MAAESDHSYWARALKRKGRQLALSSRMDRAMHQSRMPGSWTLAARRHRTRGGLQQLRRTAAQCATASRSTSQVKAASSDDLPAEPTRSLAGAYAVSIHSFNQELPSVTLPNFLLKIKERPVGARPLVAWGYGRNMPDATCGSSRTSRHRSLSDKGRLPQGPTYRRSRSTRVHLPFWGSPGPWSNGPITAVRKYLIVTL